MIADVAEALDHAHEHGVIHRDVKPSNLLLGPDGRLSINDFGLARMLEQPGMTISGEFVGSPLYMSPEQITAGRVSIDHRTDIYSLGATLYELLTFQPPFPGETRDQVLSQILHKEPVPPRRLNRKVPVDLETICMKAIERDPDRRYLTAEQLAKDLRAFVNRHAISARRLGFIGRTAKYVKRNPIAAAFGLFVLMTAVGIGTDWRLKSEKARVDEIAELQGKLIEDVFRGVTSKADTLIKIATRLRANDEQIEFMYGLKDVFNQDYEHSIVHFDRVLAIDANHIPSQALRAIATLWHGDEYSYFEQINKIDPSHAQTFEEKFFLGYAYTWGDSQLAEELLNAAEKSDPGHQYVRFLRRVARRNIATLVALSADDAKITIDAAYEDITRLSAGLEPTPLVLKERTWVCIDRAGIYRELATAYPEQADAYLLQAERDMQLASGYLNELLRDENQIREDTQYAVVTLLIQLGDDDTLKRITDNWLETPNRPIMVYAAQTLALYFLEKHDDERAGDWAKRFSGNVANNSKFVKYFR